jgi:integrase/recombinase XerD
MVKRGIIAKNPAEPLPDRRKHPSDKHQPLAAEQLFRLLATVNRDNWLGRRNHLIIAMLWCLGLRISELIGLTIASFEPDHAPDNRIGLLRIKGKNQKQRALFVVGTSLVRRRMRRAPDEA